MKVIICGAGVVGYNLALQLASEKIDVTVIDQKEELIKRISDNLDVQVVKGFASYPDVLEQAGCANADMIIAVTFSDEVNMMACQVAHSLFSTPMRIARVRAQSYLDPEYSTIFSRDNLPIDVIISPEKEVANAVFSRLEVLGATNIKPFAEGKLRLISIKMSEESPLLDSFVNQVYKLFPTLDIRIVGVCHDNVMIVPALDCQMQVGDEVFFIVRTEHLARAMAAFGYGEGEAHRVVIIGGGNVGLYLASLLESPAVNIKAKIIESDLKRAEFISERLQKTTVLHGSALDLDLLREANINQVEAVICVTNDDEVNVISSLLAKLEGAKRSFTIVNNTSYDSLTESIGADVMINPRTITVSGVLRHVRRGRVKDLHSVRDGAAEAIEIEALATSKFVGRTVGEVTFLGMEIGGILRGDTLIFPNEDTEIKANDYVVIFALKDAVKKVEKQFSVTLDFF